MRMMTEDGAHFYICWQKPGNQAASAYSAMYIFASVAPPSSLFLLTDDNRHSRIRMARPLDICILSHLMWHQEMPSFKYICLNKCEQNRLHLLSV